MSRLKREVALNVDLALLADYASISRENKLTAAGIFDLIRPPELPWSHPTMHLALRVHFHSGEEGEHKVKIRLVDPDGVEVVGLDADAMVEKLDSLEGGSVQLVLGLNNVPFKTGGRHAFDIFLDGRYEHTIPLLVVAPPSQVNTHE
jgi:hypothetical protein